MEYISLGGDCAVSYHLQKHHLRMHAYPLDWVLSPRISNCLQDEFRELWSEPILTWKNKTRSFPLLDEDWEEGNAELCRVVNRVYNITFLHDVSCLDDVPDVRKKYERRISRFHAVMRNPDIVKKCFRMGKHEELVDICKELGYVNVHLYQCEPVSGTDWKRDEWDWKGWFSSEPDCKW
jgi:hypothetical protein